MTKRLILIALFISMLGIIGTNAGAVDAPHTSSCITCHNSTAPADSNLFNGTCLKCHSATGSSVYKFSDADQGNTSHRWGGSVVNPGAGAQSPSVGAMVQVQGYTGSQLSCANCHNPHLDTNKRFQRIANNADQMCLDCHRSRAATTAATGTHPVFVGYSAAVKASPANFVGMTPVNANPANPTSDLGSRFSADGKILCSTCHRVHSADSRSSNYVNGFKNLSSGDGNLLRTNPRGAKVATGAPDSINICTNCHTGKMSHNGKGQDIQCIDCHGAHVEYDPRDPTAAQGRNIKLIRRYMPGSSSQVFFRYTGSRLEYKNGSGTGVCEGCHTPPASIPEHASTDPKVCNKCHAHNSTKGSFTASCDSCHGYPPTVTQWFDPGKPHSSNNDCSLCHNTSPSVHMNNVLDLRCDGCHGFPPNYPNGSTKANSHGSHNFSCDKCHFGTTSTGTTVTNSANHENGVYDVTAGPGASFTYQYLSTGGTCSNINCHSGSGILSNTAPVSWGTALGCIGCHGDSSTLASGSHAKHLQKGAGCADCHSATAKTNTTLVANGAHMDSAVEVNGSRLAGMSSNKTCTSACHLAATPQWGIASTGACGTCHATVPSPGSALIASGAHFAHFSSSATSYGPMLTQTSVASCQACHSNSGDPSPAHVNGVVDFNIGLGYLSAGTGTCTPCHQQRVSWTSGAVTCESCHTGTLSVINGVTAKDKGLAATRGHGAAGKGCLSCHDRNQRHIGGAGRLIAPLTVSFNAECSYCHNNAAVVQANHLNMASHVTTKGGDATMACTTCHDPHGTSNLSQIRTVINGQSITYTEAGAGLVNLTTNMGLCQVCHTKTAHYQAGVPETGGHPTTGCLSCHKHDATRAAFMPTGTCDACHGYPPAPKRTASAVIFGRMNNWSSARFEDYSGGGGAHLVAAHVSPFAKASEGWANCTVCHNAGATDSAPYHKMAIPVKDYIENITVMVDNSLRFANSFTVYTGARLTSVPGANVTGSCFNIACHMSPSVRWSSER